MAWGGGAGVAVMVGAALYMLKKMKSRNTEALVENNSTGPLREE